MKAIKDKVDKVSILEITNKDNKKIFEIDEGGKVFWLKNGKFTQAKIDKNLSLAFMVAICEGLGISYGRVIQKIREGKTL